MHGRTPSQTIGPFFHEALRSKDGYACEPGSRVVLIGCVSDGRGRAVDDALIEAWAHEPAGNPSRLHRAQTTAHGRYRIGMPMPGGAVPFLHVAIFVRGLTEPLLTRAYLAPEMSVRSDPALAELADAPRLATLVAQRARDGVYRWDVRLQGELETVFFAPA